MRSSPAAASRSEESNASMLSNSSAHIFIGSRIEASPSSPSQTRHWWTAPKDAALTPSPGEIRN
eukprot:1254503-Pyramimonas_sp.AAC.1